MSQYDKYLEYINSFSNDSDLPPFKSHAAYTEILEHVPYESGIEYVNILRSIDLDLEIMRSFCQENDRIGGGKKFWYANFGETSPTNFRYLLHAHLILTHFKKQQTGPISIVEIGGGYGGLCLAIGMLHNIYNVDIINYHIVDLAPSTKLQSKYLKNRDMDYPVIFHDAANFGQDVNEQNLFLISNYCFSEIDADSQKKYRENLFPKVGHGFMVWNLIPVYDFGFKVHQEREYPLTYNGNCYLYF